MQRLGRLKSTTVTTTRHDNNDTQRRHSSFSYYPLGHGMNGLLKTESIKIYGQASIKKWILSSFCWIGILILRDLNREGLLVLDNR